VLCSANDFALSRGGATVTAQDVAHAAEELDCGFILKGEQHLISFSFSCFSILSLSSWWHLNDVVSSSLYLTLFYSFYHTARENHEKEKDSDDEEEDNENENENMEEKSDNEAENNTQEKNDSAECDDDDDDDENNENDEEMDMWSKVNCFAFPSFGDINKEMIFVCFFFSL